MKQLNFNQMSELVGGDLSQNQQCLINGVGVGLSIVCALIFTPALGLVGAGAYSALDHCF